MKKIFTTLAFLGVFAASACWFTESNFNTAYIASVNGKVIHYQPVSVLGEATYRNGQSAELPLTVQIKVADRFGDQQGESGVKPIVKAVLQYKLIRANGGTTSFVTVKTLDHPSWKMNFNNPVNLFGSDGVIDIPEGEIAAGDEIIIRVWFSDGVYSTGDPEADLTGDQVPEVQNSANINCGGDGWKAPHVFRVKFSGKRRVMI